MANLVAIHADCEDLVFLKPLQKSIAGLDGVSVDWHCLNSEYSHEIAQDAIKQPTARLICIFLHGRTDGFRGGDYENEQDPNKVSMFLRKGDMHAFKDKVVFCLSCNGNTHASEVVDGGAIAYLGFDDVPFVRYDPLTEDEIVQRSLTLHCQSLIRSAVEAGLSHFIHSGETLAETASFIQLWVRQSAVEFIRNNQSERYRNDIVSLFMVMADTIKVYGNGDITWRDIM